MSVAKTLRRFEGGIAITNSYYFECEKKKFLVDAPEGACAWLADLLGTEAKLDFLLLTHQHFDHVWDAAEIKRSFKPQVIAWQKADENITLSETLRMFMPEVKLDPTPIDSVLSEDKALCAKLAAEFVLDFQHVPGHSPDSVCYHFPNEKIIFAGDTLFKNGVGRTDLAGGNEELLFKNIREKLFSLDDATQVYPGHGESSKIGTEKINNPFFV